MGLGLTAVGIKWLTVTTVLLFFGLIGAPTPTEAAVVGGVVAILSYWGDKVLPFRMQGVTRWALDAGLAAVTIYAVQFLWPGPNLSLYAAVFAGALIGAIEIPIHFLLASRFGLRLRSGDERNGVR